jgi:hypothetical protein
MPTTLSTPAGCSSPRVSSPRHRTVAHATLRPALATSLAEGIFLSHDNHCSARVGDPQTSPTNEPNAHNQQP